MVSVSRRLPLFKCRGGSVTPSGLTCEVREQQTVPSVHSGPDTVGHMLVVIRSTAKVWETELAKVAKTPAKIRSPFWAHDLLDQAELLELQEVGPEACVALLVT